MPCVTNKPDKSSEAADEASGTGLILLSFAGHFMDQSAI